MKKIALLFAAILAISCSGVVFSESDMSFVENRWRKADIKVYEFEVAKDESPCEVEVFFSHVYGYQFASIPLVAEITHPDGTIESLSFDLKLKDGSNAEIGDCAGDYCDLTQKIEFSKPLSAGEYKLRLMHNFPGEYVPNVLGLGIKVKKTEN